MKRLIPLLIILTACGPQQFLTESEYKTIPKECTTILARSSLLVEAYYIQIVDTLLTEGYRIAATDKTLYYINTDEHDCGLDTYLRMTINLSREGDSSIARVIPEWKYGSTTALYGSAFGYYTAPQWNSAKPGQMGKSNLAFTKALRTFQKVSSSISYK